MCGRYAITTPPAAVRDWFRYEEQPNFPPRFNVAPTQPIPIVSRAPDAPAGPERHFRLVRWGLVPPFVRDFRAFPLLINARGEEVAAKPSFRAAMMRRRCLVIADAWYEWRRGPDPRRAGTPFLFRRTDGRPIGFAGLWERWMGADGSELETACVVTVAAEGAAAAIHPRMPAVLAPADYERWLDVDGVPPGAAATLLRPAEGITAFAVGPAVNKVANDDPSVQAPAPPEPVQASLF